MYMRANSGNFIGVGAGAYTADASLTLSRTSRVVELWIPGKKFTKSGVITYEDNSIQVKKIDYHVVLYAYSNYSTAQDIGP
jgi:hypothetical protein